MRQLLIESVLLSILGGVLGLLIAQYGVHSFDQATQNVGKPYWIVFEMDYRVFAYFAAICVLSGIVFGLTPALRATRIDTATVLKDSGKGSTGHRGGKLASVLVVFQFALTAILLSGAGLMVRSFAVTRSINNFLPHEEVFTVRINLPGGEGALYQEEQARLNFYDNLYRRFVSCLVLQELRLPPILRDSETFDVELKLRGNQWLTKMKRLRQPL